MLDFGKVRPQLCKLEVRPFDRLGWVWERKYDGVRMLAFVDGDRVRLQSRSGRDKTAMFPELQAIRTSVPMVLDGEVVSATGLSFQDFAQRRANRTKDVMDILREAPAKLMAFDVLEAHGRDLSTWPLWNRQLYLIENMMHDGPAEWVHSFRTGVWLFGRANEEGWEGVVGKDESAPYEFGKRRWVKVKVWRDGVFEAVGWNQGQGRREGLAASFLLLDPETKRPVGHVGTGFDDAELRRLTQLMKDATGPVYFKVKYCEVTNDGRLRFPVYLGTCDKED